MRHRASSPIPRPYRDFVVLFMLSGSVVFVEPAPYDFIFIALLFGGLVFSYLEFPRQIMPPVLALAVFIEANLVSMFFSVRGPQIAAKFFTITFYLALSWLFFCGLFNKYKEPALDVVLSSYLASALFATIVAILAYFRFIPDFGLLVRVSGRLTGFFKDPNVFGPFLVLPALISLGKLERETRVGSTIAWSGAFIVLVTGVLLSFSRAAWVNLAIALVAYAVLPSHVTLSRRLRKALVVLAFAAPTALAICAIPKVNNLLVGRLGVLHYDLNRFGTHKNAFVLAMSNPLGLGPAQSAIQFGMSPHSLYIRTISEYGFLGILSLLSLIALTMIRALSGVFSKGSDRSPYSSAITASLLGVLVNSAVIDTLHWRHFWLLLALPWIVTPAKEETHR